MGLSSDVVRTGPGRPSSGIVRNDVDENGGVVSLEDFLIIKTFIISSME